MILPIGLEDNKIHRQPWVTYGIMLLCGALFLLTHFTTQRRLSDGLALLGQAVEYYQAHPYLRLDPRLQRILEANGMGGTGALLGDAAGRSQAPEPDFASLEQVELDTLIGSGFDILDTLPLRRFGLVPAHISLFGLVAHMFLHAGLLHLLGNMLFLYLSGPFLEDLWGRPFFAAFYLAAGLVSGTFFALRYLGLDAPLVGASGAISGAIGAFMIRHWNRRIRFFYWFGIVFRGTFTAPALAVLPLYFAREFLSAYTMDVVAPGAGGAGVAYWAHVSGFGFGAVTAAALKWGGLEERYLAPKLEGRLTVIDNRGLDQALAKRGEGRVDEAWQLLAREARKGPTSADAVLALWDLALETGRAAEAAPHLARLVRDEVQGGATFEAFGHWRELRKHAPAAPVPLLLEARLAEGLGGLGMGEEAADVIRAAAETAGADAPVNALVRLVRLASGPERARVAALALSHPELPSGLRGEIEALAPTSGRVQPAPARLPEAAPSRSAAPVPSAVGVLTLTAVPAVPIALGDQSLVLEVAGGARRTLSFQRVRAAGAGEVDESLSGEPTRILDLFLELPSPGGSEARAIRIDTARFDPRRLVATEESPREAFLSLVASVASAGRVTWLLGEGVHRLGTYASRSAYESDLLRRLQLSLLAP